MRKPRARVLTEHEREWREIEDKCLAELAELRREEGSTFVFGPALVWLRQTLRVVEARKMALAEMLKLNPEELDRVRKLELFAEVFKEKEELSRFMRSLVDARAMWRDLRELVEAPRLPWANEIAVAVQEARKARKPAG